MEKEYQMSWLKVIVGVVLIAVIVAVLCLIIPNKSKGNLLASNTYITNINLMKEAGFDYFKGSNLPEKIGETREITLKEMIDNNLIIEFYDENGGICDTYNSSVKVTKTIDNEYAMKVALNCDSKNDYIVTSISDIEYTIVNVEESKDIDDTKNDNISSNGNSNNTSSVPIINNSNVNNQNTNITYINNCLNDSCKNNTYYTVAFDTQGGSYVPKQIIKYGNSVSYANTYREGYKFLGWYYNGEEYNFNQPVTFTMTLVAKWQKVDNSTSNKTYIVRFMSNGGTTINPVTVLNNTKVSRPSDPVLTCYDFEGWYTDSSLTNKYDFNTLVSSDLVLYAKWVKSKACESDTSTHNVTYVYNNGNTAKTITVKDGEYLSVPENPTLYCYTFDGWYANNTLTNKYNFNEPVTKDIVLYAKWTQNDTCSATHKVTYIYNNGTTAKTVTVKDGEYLSVPENPVFDCYSFGGWYTNSTLTSRYNFNQSVTKDIVLYAKWIQNDTCSVTHKITYIYNNGTTAKTVTVKDGEYLSMPVVPTRNGYTFVGWYNNNEKFNFNRRIYKDYVIEAVWEKEQVQYNKYCLKREQRFYSTSYVSASQTTWSYDWTIKFDKLTNASNVKVSNIGYFSNISMYNSAYNDYVRGREISQVGGNEKYSVPFTSGAMLSAYSLKTSNFDKRLSSPYYYRGNWYVNAHVDIRNYYNLTKYYASNIKSEIYFVPFYFDISYTDNNNCVVDLASRSSYYKNYDIIETFYE